MYIKGFVTKGKSILHFISFGVDVSVISSCLYFFVVVFSLCTVQESLFKDPAETFFRC